MRRLATRALICVAFYATLAAACGPPPVPAAPDYLARSFHLVETITDLDLPTVVDFTSDGRVFVAEIAGKVKAFDSLNATSPTATIDLTDEVYNHADRGIMGMAVDPLFESSRPYVYILYSAEAPLYGDNPHTLDSCNLPAIDGCVVKSKLAKLTIDQTTLELVGAPLILSDNWCHRFTSHSVGGVEIGDDGALYAASGDGANFNNVDYGQLLGSQVINPCNGAPTGTGVAPTAPTAMGGAMRSQDAAVPVPGFSPTFNGSVIKIDPDTGDAWPTNPWASDPDPERAKIVGYGFRNPFRFTTQPGTNNLFVSDVGWVGWEEINKIETDGADVPNFGWPCLEGPEPQAGYEAVGLDGCTRLYNDPSLVADAFFAYPRVPEIVEGDKCSIGGQSAAGAGFYPGGNYPAKYNGGMFFTDHGLGCMWFFPLDAQGNPSIEDGELMMRGTNAADLTIGPAGDVFLVDHTAGTILRFTYDENNTPIARANANITQGAAPLSVVFGAGGSYDPDPGDTITYEWDTDGDGEYDDGNEFSTTAVYADEGLYQATLRVTDSFGAQDTDTVTIDVGDQYPTPVIDTPSPGLIWGSGDPISFSGSATDVQDGTLPPSAFQWQTFIHHCVSDNPGDCHVHPLTTTTGVTSGSFVAPDHAYPSYVELRLTVTDSNGNSVSTSMDLAPETIDLTLGAAPAGVTVSIGEETLTAPGMVQLIRNSPTTVVAAPTQTVGGIVYEFVEWSDGGAAIHEIIPSADMSLTAVYVPASP